MLLCQEEITLLSWLGDQPEPVTAEQFSMAPCYDEKRRETLRKNGYIWTPSVGFFDSQLRTYALTDSGRAAASEAKEKRNKEAADKAQQRFQNKISVAQVVVPVVTFILGLLVEHYWSVL